MLKTIAHALDPESDALSLLKDDHRKVEGLFKEYEAAEGKREQGNIAKQICKELSIHTQIEERIFYPAAKGEVKDARDEVNEAVVEHSAVKRLVEELEGMSPGDEMFKAKMMVLMEFVKHHVREEEKEMFPKLTESDLDLKELGAELMQAKQRLESGEDTRMPGARRSAATKRKAPSTASRSRSATGRSNGRGRGDSRARV